MGLTREAYQALADIVGTEYITEEPAVLDGYCFMWGNEAIFGDKFSARPPAVIMPGSVEEVQAIVKVCNKFKIRYKAHASGFEVVALSAREPFLPMDLRRMNRILEIDEKNKYAVVEPYVTSRNLINETIKLGIRPYAVGCGPTGSVIASSSCHFGSGASNLSADYGGRTPLGVEWVLPDGEILRLGSLGTGSGWFTGDGPGPSLRGVMRGYGGANGGLGIMTKVAVKLVPWYGPEKIEAKGRPPSYDCDVPENFATYMISFPSQNRLVDCFYLLTEECIGFSGLQNAGNFMINLIAESNDELFGMVQTAPPELIEKLRYTALVILDASSQEEMQYRKKCFEKILEKTEGTIFPLDSRANGIMYLCHTTGQGMTRAFRIGGGLALAPVGDDSLDSIGKVWERGYKEILEKHEQAGEILAAPWAPLYSDSSYGHMEGTCVYDAANPDVAKVIGEIGAEADTKVAQWSLAINSLEGALSFEESALKAADPYCLNLLSWMKKVKRAFDPNLVSESSFYVT